MTTTKTGDQPEVPLLNPSAAAMDIGATMHKAAVSPDASETPNRAFGTFTEDLRALAEWFRACGVTSVAMESNGVYWIPAFEILEQHGFEVILVNARYVRNVPGRKVSVRACGVISAPARAAGGVRRGAYSAHAEGAHGDEPPAAPRWLGYDRGDRDADHPCSGGGDWAEVCRPLRGYGT